MAELQEGYLKSTRKGQPNELPNFSNDKRVPSNLNNFGQQLTGNNPMKCMKHTEVIVNDPTCKEITKDLGIKLNEGWEGRFDHHICHYRLELQKRCVENPDRNKIW